jgi:hypothetical protein
MKAKAAIVSIFALVLAAAVISGEQHRLRTEAAADGEARIERLHIATKEYDVTN